MKRFAKFAVVATGVASIGLSGAIAYAATAPTANGQVRSCYSKSTGALRVRTAAHPQCVTGETPLNWSQTGVNNWQIVTATIPVAGLVAQEVRAYCPAGTNVMGGGYTSDVNINYTQQVAIQGSVPVNDADGHYWSTTFANFQNPANAGSTINASVYAVCASYSPAPASAGASAATATTAGSHAQPAARSLARH